MGSVAWFGKDAPAPMHDEGMASIDVTCSPSEQGWTCTVMVHEAGSSSRHLVGVDRDTLARLAPGDAGPEGLVRRSFEFLLEREPKESILGRFDLPLIGHYFPEYERTVRGSGR